MMGLVLGGAALQVFGLGIVVREIVQNRKDAKDVLIPGEFPVNHGIDFKGAVSLETKQTAADVARLQGWLSTRIVGGVRSKLWGAVLTAVGIVLTLVGAL